MARVSCFPALAAPNLTFLAAGHDKAHSEDNASPLFRQCLHALAHPRLALMTCTITMMQQWTHHDDVEGDVAVVLAAAALNTA